MKTATTHYAKTHLSRLLKDVQKGETVIILHGSVPVGKLIAVDDVPAQKRPKAGSVTSGTVTCTDDAFAPMGEEELAEWGL